MLRPGFEPESSARKAEMIGRTTLPELMKNLFFMRSKALLLKANEIFYFVAFESFAFDAPNIPCSRALKIFDF